MHGSRREFVPVEAKNAYRVRADEDSGRWSLEVYALCADAPGGLEYATARGSENAPHDSAIAETRP